MGLTCAPRPRDSKCCPTVMTVRDGLAYVQTQLEPSTVYKPNIQKKIILYIYNFCISLIICTGKKTEIKVVITIKAHNRQNGFVFAKCLLQSQKLRKQSWKALQKGPFEPSMHACPLQDSEARRTDQNVIRRLRLSSCVPAK